MSKNVGEKTENYYDSVITKIEELIASEKKDEAFDILKEELSQAYIPKETQQRLEEIFEQEFVQEVVEKQVSIEEARSGLLNLSIETIVQNFFTLNLRMLEKEILYYLENSEDYLSMSLLIYNLIDQGVTIDFTLTKFGITDSFNTMGVNIVDEDVMLMHAELYAREFEKNPVYAKYCVDILSYYFFVTFPFKLDNDFELYQEVVNYVKKVSGISTEENHKEFIKIIEYGG